MVELQEKFSIFDEQLIVQPADDSEVGGNGGRILHPVQGGDWTASLTFDPDQNLDVLISCSNIVKNQKPLWVKTGVTLLSDVNVLCLISLSKFPDDDRYEEWWTHAIDVLQGTRLAPVDGGILIVCSDGVPSDLWIWRESELVVGILVTLPDF